MKSQTPVTAFSPHELIRFMAPVTTAMALFMLVILIDGLLITQKPDLWMVLYGLGGLIYLAILTALVKKSVFFHEKYGWYHSLLTGGALGLLPAILPTDIAKLFPILLVLNVIVVTIISGRFYAVSALMMTILVGLPNNMQAFTNLEHALDYFGPFIVSLIAMETYARIKSTTQQHIQRLETINKVSRQLMQSLDTTQVLSLLNETILDTLKADSYFLGTLKGDNICLDLMYDDGEFFNGTELPVQGTLSGWVIKNQRELFLPDLREDVHLEGVDVRVIGKERISLSWIGVPLKAPNITGIMVMASYTPNAFDLGDLELLSNLAQHVTLALDNSARHAQVEEQARLDSLTGVYNHGYFLKKLAEQAEHALATNTPLSLIMLDIDYFKQYNDTYGHLVGDRILTAFCTAIKKNIKIGDAVGRWGGEEFIISLPNATSEQALQVAKRIGQTMAILKVEDRMQKTVPIPTASQGIAVYPAEANEIYRLIDLADKRLYKAKKRGRNQIEQGFGHKAKILAD